MAGVSRRSTVLLKDPSELLTKSATDADFFKTDLRQSVHNA